MALITASVPEETNRTRSIMGKTDLTFRASRISPMCGAPYDVPRAMVLVTAFSTFGCA